MARACGFYVLIEATQKTGATQWSQELAQTLRHAEDFATAEGIEADEIHTVIVCPRLRRDTYALVRHSNQDEQQPFKIALLEVKSLAAALTAAELAPTLRHADVQDLFTELLDAVATADTLERFRRSADRCIEHWISTVLNGEKQTFVAIKAYEAMVRERRPSVATSEILARLNNHTRLKHYLRLIDSLPLGARLVEESLESERLAVVLGRIPPAELLFKPVAATDYCSRRERCMKMVRQIDGER